MSAIKRTVTAVCKACGNRVKHAYDDNGKAQPLPHNCEPIDPSRRVGRTELDTK